MQEASLTTRIKNWLENIPIFTKIILGICVSLYILQLFTDWPKTRVVCLSAFDMLQSVSQSYRLVTYIVFHAGILHIVLNMMAHLSLGTALEIKVGTMHTFVSVLFFTVFSSAFQLSLGATLYYWPWLLKNLKSIMGDWPVEQIFSCGIGYSGILFAQMVSSAYVFEQETQSLFGGLSVPAKIYPWILLIISQFIMPGVSFIGHLSGMIAGYIYVFVFYKTALWNLVCSKLDSFVPQIVRNYPGYMSDSSAPGYIPVSQISGDSDSSTTSDVESQHPVGVFEGRGRVLGTR